MRIASLLRRSTAVLAATALLSAGGTGLLAGPANAALPAPVITDLSPAASNNAGSVRVTLKGDNFVASQDSVKLVPTFPGTEVGCNASLTCGGISGSIPAGQVSKNELQVDFNLTLAAPGSYNVELSQNDPTTSPATSVKVTFCCFGVTSLGPPNATSTVFGVDTPTGSTPASNTDRGPGPVDIIGTNFARGAKVDLLLPNGFVDPQATFTVGNGSARKLTAYPTANLIRGNFATSPDWTSYGKHFVKVTNTDGKSGTTAEFWLPIFFNVSPTTRGVGSRNQIVTLTGAGIRDGSAISIADLDTRSDCSDVTVGQATVNADGTSISAPVSLVNTCSGRSVGLGGRAVAINGPDGGSYTKPNAFTATAAPVVDYPGSGLKVGRGGSIANVYLTGTGFVPGVRFSFGDPKVTSVVQGVGGDGKSALITISATSDAKLGDHDITVTNPDTGTSTTTAADTLDPTAPAPLIVDPAPLVASVSPGSAGLGTTRSISISGSDFESPGTNAGLVVSFSRPGITVSNLQVTQGSNGAADTATFTVTVANNTVAGLSDLIVRNTGDGGSSTCVGCFGVDSLSISPTADSNNGVATLTFNGKGLTLTSDPYLTAVGGNPDQPDIHLVPGGPLSLSANGNSLTGTFDLTRAAPGKYSGIASSNASGSPVQLSCSGCFTVTGQAATLTGIRRPYDPTTVVKTSAGQGALNVPVALTGTNFSHGQLVVLQTKDAAGNVTPSKATVHDVRFVSPTQLTALVDVPADAATGAQDVVLKNADGQFPFTYAGAFTINPGPVPTAVSPAAAGQGAAARQVTVTGPGFDPKPTVDFGPGITVTAVTVTQGATSPTDSNPPDTLVATINVDEAAATGPRTITITNPDSGQGSLAGKFAVNLGPKVQSISPALLQPGAEADVTFIGTGFKDDPSQASAPHPVITIANVTATVASVSADGTSMVAHLKAQSPCPSTADPVCVLGARAVTVANKTDGGRTIKADAFSIATLPTAPRNVAVAFNSAGTEATLTWDAPANDGGSPVSSYLVDEGDNAVAEKTVPASPTSYTFTGLTSGRSYLFTVKANNAVGTGPAGSAQSAFTTVLSSTRSKAVPVSGDLIRYTGKLTRSTGAGAPNAAIVVTLDPDVGPTRVFTTYTNSTGVWGFRFPTYYNMTVSARFGGNGTDKAISAATYRFGTATRVVKKSPAGGATTSSSSPLIVTGYVSPAKTGRTVYLVNGSNKVVGKGVVLSDRTFRISSALPRGSYALRITIAAGGGNVFGASPFFLAYRS